MRSFTGVGLFYKMQTSFGHFTAGSGFGGRVWPVVFGETGSFYTAVRCPGTLRMRTSGWLGMSGQDPVFLRPHVTACMVSAALPEARALAAEGSVGSSARYAADQRCGLPALPPCMHDETTD